MRLFVAIPIPDPIANDLALMRTSIKGANWCVPADMHLTLHFIGDAMAGDIDEIAEVLQDIDQQELSLTLSSVGYFGNSKAPRTLWAGVVDCPPLFELQRKIEAAMEDIGFPGAERKFHAHVTLARLRDTGLDKVGEFMQTFGLYKSHPLPVKEFILYSSKLKPNGAEYRREAIFPLLEN